MPYNPDTHKITGAVGLHDIARALGAAKDEELRDHNNINKWAIYKQMPKDGPDPLDDFSGTDAAKNSGEFYGIKMALGNANQDWRDIHSINFAYHRSRGRDYGEWFRATDFDGYNAEAPMELRGVFNTLVGYYDLDFEVRINQTQVPDDTVSIKSCLNATSDEAIIPCCLISDGTHYWAAALYNPTRQAFTGLAYAGAKQELFAIPFHTSETTNPISAAGTYTISLFLTKASNVAGAFKTDGKWYAISWNPSPYPAVQQRPFGVPDGMNKRVALSQYGILPPPILVRSEAATSTGYRFAINWARPSGLSESRYFNYELDMMIGRMENNNFIPGGEMVVRTNASPCDAYTPLPRDVIVLVDYTEHQWNPVPGATYTVKVTAKTGWQSTTAMPVVVDYYLNLTVPR